jgi:ERCC4-type nuclease
VAAVVEMVSYYRKTEHLSLSTRPKAVGSDHWGRTTPHHEMLFFLQGLPLVGPKLAEAILQHFSGLPLGWTCTPGDLRAVPGIGPNRVKRIWEFFNGKPIT